MKFGKSLQRVVDLSDPEWAPFWLSYKALKRLLKLTEGMERARERASSEADRVARDAVREGSMPEAMAKHPGEVAFFKLLRQELRKCNDFFNSAEEQFRTRQTRVQEGWRQLTAPEIVVDGTPHKYLMSACVKLYKDLLLLENYAIMNYCGFSKILKKHDKLRPNFTTRAQFMKNVVNHAPFAQYPGVVAMLQEIEMLFNQIQSASPQMPGESGDKLLMIDTMRSINTEASIMQQQEAADLEDSLPMGMDRRSEGRRIKHQTDDLRLRGTASPSTTSSPDLAHSGNI